MPKPDFIDNLNGNTMVAALRQLLKDNGNVASVVADTAAQVDEARIATAYFSPEGFTRIASAIALVPSIKLLLGSDPIKDNERWQRKIGETEQGFIERKLHHNLQQQEAALRDERDHIPFTRDSSRAVRQLVAALCAGNMEVRRYEKNFLHAKAYIFTSASTGDDDKPEAVIAGSSNLTVAGLLTSLELNLGRYETATVVKAKRWFDQLWAEAKPFDLAAFFEEVFEPKTPYEIFLRVLWELYGDEVEKDQKEDKGIPLTSFQKHGVVRALRLIEETGGVIVADEVGLGKTYIAGEILQYYRDRRQRALLVCPAALRDSSWKSFINEYEIYLEVLSFEELARDKQLRDEEKRPHSNQENLERNIEEYQLIIIDEAHNYRNPDSSHRADALRALLYGKRKDVLMLTATPVNNSLWDLYHLTRYFLKQDAFLANKGILSIKERFDHAMQTDPNNLSPDVLYPIIDATTVKRTRQFIRKHYSHDQIKGPDGKMQIIVFPEPKAISVRYDLDSLMPGLFDLIETYFDPENEECILFARYKAAAYLNQPDPDGKHVASGITGFLLSGLLKRFESSTNAFSASIKRLIDQHEQFLEQLGKGYVITTEFFKESDGTDDEDFEELLESSENSFDARLYDVERLHDDATSDLAKLRKISTLLKKITASNDPKLQVLVKQLEVIAKEAESKASSREDEMNKRKVLIFSFFADTVRWIRDYLKTEIDSNPSLACYRKRFDIVVGSGAGESGDKARAAVRFAPDTAGKPGDRNELDILISTDVLAEGVNLQQARHIINYDMPWNPMRLVQRHGRIDRINSQHNRVFMRTIFPADRLDALLKLEERIALKIAMAAVSVGVVSPIAEVRGGTRNFTETREEIQKLLDEDASLYERGGTVAGAQSGEEYRQTLRRALVAQRDGIVQMPWKAGSGMCRGSDRGIFFCAKVGERTYLRFVHADENWQVKCEQDGNEENSKPMIDGEIGRCLRFIECMEDQKLVLDASAQDAAYDLWLEARKNIHKHWMHETDPANLLPRVRPLNQTVAKHIRENKANDIEQASIDKALNIVEAPWSRRDERRLREWFKRDYVSASEKTKSLIDKILRSGLEPFEAPRPLPPIEEEDIELLVWMAITPA